MPTAQIVEESHWLEQGCALALLCIHLVSRGNGNNELVNVFPLAPSLVAELNPVNQSICVALLRHLAFISTVFGMRPLL